MRRILLAIVIVSLGCLLTRPTWGQTVASILGSGPDMNLTAFGFGGLPLGVTPFASNPFSLEFTDGDDVFGVETRNLLETNLSRDVVPDALLDDSLAGSDNLGIIKAADNAPFFGVTDTVNGDNGDPLTVQWTFDTSLSTTGLFLSIDFAAMGDFESSDNFLVEASFDNAPFQTIFETEFLGALANVPYTLEDGTVETLNDPLAINGVQLDNNFSTLSAAIPGGGAALAVRFTADTNGGNEVFAFRNLVVTVGNPGGDGLPGDFNDDGEVNAADYTVWRDNLGATENGAVLSGNGNGGTVDETDYQLWQSSFGNANAVAAANAVPEPATSMLLAFAGSAVLFGRRRGCEAALLLGRDGQQLAADRF